MDIKTYSLGYYIKKSVAVFITICMLLSLLPAYVFADSNNSDMPAEGTWSYDAWQNAIDQGIFKGDKSGNLYPNNYITRAEFASVLTRLFAATEEADISQSRDMKASRWYYSAIAKAVQMKIMFGCDDNKMKPNAKVTREQAFTMLGRAIKAESESLDALKSFADSNKLTSYSISYIAALVEADIINGNNGNLNPNSYITRAEVAQLIYKTFSTYITTAGEYSGEMKGNVIVNVPGVILKNAKIAGDLILADGVGDGEVTIDNTTIGGKLVVRGGGANSIKIVNGTNIGSIVVAKSASGDLRIYCADGAKVNIVRIDDGSDAIKVEGSFNIVNVESNAEVVLDNATVNELNISAPSADVNVQSGSIAIVTITETANNAKLETAPSTKINTLNLKADADVQAKGQVKNVAASENITVTGTNNITKEVEKAQNTETKTEEKHTSAGGSSSGDIIQPKKGVITVKTEAEFLNAIHNFEAGIDYNEIEVDGIITISNQYIDLSETTLTLEKKASLGMDNSSLFISNGKLQNFGSIKISNSNVNVGRTEITNDGTFDLLCSDMYLNYTTLVNNDVFNNKAGVWLRNTSKFENKKTYHSETVYQSSMYSWNGSIHVCAGTVATGLQGETLKFEGSIPNYYYADGSVRKGLNNAVNVSEGTIIQPLSNRYVAYVYGQNAIDNAINDTNYKYTEYVLEPNPLNEEEIVTLNLNNVDNMVVSTNANLKLRDNETTTLKTAQIYGTFIVPVNSKLRVNSIETGLESTITTEGEISINSVYHSQIRHNFNVLEKGILNVFNGQLGIASHGNLMILGTANISNNALLTIASYGNLNIMGSLSNNRSNITVNYGATIQGSGKYDYIGSTNYQGIEVDNCSIITGPIGQYGIKAVRLNSSAIDNYYEDGSSGLALETLDIDESIKILLPEKGLCANVYGQKGFEEYLKNKTKYNVVNLYAGNDSIVIDSDTNVDELSIMSGIVTVDSETNLNVRALLVNGISFTNNGTITANNIDVFSEFYNSGTLNIGNSKNPMHGSINIYFGGRLINSGIINNNASIIDVQWGSFVGNGTYNSTNGGFVRIYDGAEIDSMNGLDTVFADKPVDIYKADGTIEISDINLSKVDKNINILYYDSYYITGQKLILDEISTGRGAYVCGVKGLNAFIESGKSYDNAVVELNDGDFVLNESLNTEVEELRVQGPSALTVNNNAVFKANYIYVENGASIHNRGTIIAHNINIVDGHLIYNSGETFIEGQTTTFVNDGNVTLNRVGESSAYLHIAGPQASFVQNQTSIMTVYGRVSLMNGAALIVDTPISNTGAAFFYCEDGVTLGNKLLINGKTYECKYMTSSGVELGDQSKDARVYDFDTFKLALQNDSGYEMIECDVPLNISEDLTISKDVRCSEITIGAGKTLTIAENATVQFSFINLENNAKLMNDGVIHYWNCNNKGSLSNNGSLLCMGGYSWSSTGVSERCSLDNLGTINNNGIFDIQLTYNYDADQTSLIDEIIGNVTGNKIGVSRIVGLNSINDLVSINNDINNYEVILYLGNNVTFTENFVLNKHVNFECNVKIDPDVTVTVMNGAQFDELDNKGTLECAEGTINIRGEKLSGQVKVLDGSLYVYSDTFDTDLSLENMNSYCVLYSPENINGNIAINAGRLDLYEEETFINANSFSIASSGNLYVRNDVHQESDIINDGQIYLRKQSYYELTAELINTGEIIISNEANFTINSGGVLINQGYISNTGLLTVNAGLTEETSGTLDNTNGDIYNRGRLVVNQGARFIGDGVMATSINDFAYVSRCYYTERDGTPDSQKISADVVMADGVTKTLEANEWLSKGQMCYIDEDEHCNGCKTILGSYNVFAGSLKSYKTNGYITLSGKSLSLSNECNVVNVATNKVFPVSSVNDLGIYLGQFLNCVLDESGEIRLIYVDYPEEYLSNVAYVTNYIGKISLSSQPYYRYNAFINGDLTEVYSLQEIPCNRFYCIDNELIIQNEFEPQEYGIIYDCDIDNVFKKGFYIDGELYLYDKTAVTFFDVSTNGIMLIALNNCELEIFEDCVTSIIYNSDNEIEAIYAVYSSEEAILNSLEQPNEENESILEEQLEAEVKPIVEVQTEPEQEIETDLEESEENVQPEQSPDVEPEIQQVVEMIVEEEIENTPTEEAIIPESVMEHVENESSDLASQDAA